jgi:hypothetical protein
MNAIENSIPFSFLLKYKLQVKESELLFYVKKKPSFGKDGSI